VVKPSIKPAQLKSKRPLIIVNREVLMEMESRPNVLVEPSDKVVEALRLAVKRVGVDEFSKKAQISPGLIEDLVDRKTWIPLATLRVACEINKDFPEAPLYTKSIARCIEGVQLRIPPEELKLERKPPIAEAAEVPAPIKEPPIKRETKAFPVYRMLIISTALCFMIFGLSFGGYLIGRGYGILYAGAGLFLGIILGLILTVFLIFKLKRFLM